MKVIDVLNVYQFLVQNDKYGKMGTSKVTLVMMMIKMNKIVEEFQNLQQKVQEKLLKDKKDFNENLRKAQDYENALKENKETLITEEEYKSFINGDFKEITEQLNEAMKPELEKEVDISYKKFNEESFSEWVEANNVDTQAAIWISKYILE